MVRVARHLAIWESGQGPGGNRKTMVKVQRCNRMFLCRAACAALRVRFPCARSTDCPTLWPPPRTAFSFAPREARSSGPVYSIASSNHTSSVQGSISTPTNPAPPPWRALERSRHMRRTGAVGPSLPTRALRAEARRNGRSAQATRCPQRRHRPKRGDRARAGNGCRPRPTQPRRTSHVAARRWHRTSERG